jgi:hypothetical protein
MPVNYLNYSLLPEIKKIESYETLSGIGLNPLSRAKLTDGGRLR